LVDFEQATTEVDLFLNDVHGNTSVIFNSCLVG
jgi:hypothetical protein